MRVLFMATLVASIATVSSAGDVENGKAMARQCSVCHGRIGIAQDPEVPHLAGQSAFYLEKTMKDYRDGRREDRRMTLMAQNLTDEDIADLAAWFASIDIVVTPPD
jgi:cytochrome c553